MSIDAELPRKMWRTLEPYHVLVYFVPEAKEVYDGIGLRGGRMGYFASRAAPMGAVTAEVVVATFFNFAPESVRKAIPAAWELASPEKVVQARLEVADRALRRLVPEVVDFPDVVEAAQLVRDATTDLPLEARALYAGHASLAWPEQPHLALWHGTTLLREFRGDGHLMALTVEGITGLDAVTLDVAAGSSKMPREMLQVTRGWSDEAWLGSQESLRARGLIGADGAVTEAGAAAKARVEALTDELARAPWERLGEQRSQRLRELVRPFSKAISAGIFG